MSIHVNSINQAWSKVDEIFSTDYAKDERASSNAGYAVYRSTLDGCNDYICDLGDRLEVNFYENNRTVNIWIDQKAVDTIAEDHGQIIANYAEPTRTNINTSTIYTMLIKEAAKCEYYASDIVYDIDRINRTLKDDNFLSDNKPIVFYFGFRSHGVDHESFIESRGWNSEEYRTIYRLTLKPDNSDLTATLEKIR